jgi:FkbM family methyltransferase
VVAFEPSIANAQLVQANVSANNFGNVSVIAAAVAYRNGWARFGTQSTPSVHSRRTATRSFR